MSAAAGLTMLGLAAASLATRGLGYLSVAEGLSDGAGLVSTFSELIKKQETLEDLGKRISRAVGIAIKDRYVYADEDSRDVAARAVARVLNTQDGDVIIRAVTDPVGLGRALASQMRAASLGPDTRRMCDGMLDLAMSTICVVVQQSPVFELLATKRQLQLGEAATEGIESVRGYLDEVIELLVGTANAAEVVIYLRARLGDWDRSVWRLGPGAASSIERRLRLRGKGTDTDFTEGEFSEDGALDGQQFLVVLGGPGSGKTWLARRYGRRAAERALTALEAGAAVEDVEIPVVTTWDGWSRVRDLTTRDALVASAFASGSGASDLGGGEIVARLARTLTKAGSRVLMIVDSLDEAADMSHQGDRLSELEGLSRQGWRVVVTSRHEAWHRTFTGRQSENMPRVLPCRT